MAIEMFFMSLVGALIAWIGVWLLRHFRSLQDMPNERSSHSTKTPRGAGLAFPVALLVGLLVVRLTYDSIDDTDLGWVLCGCGIGLLGFCDDAVSLSAKRRLIAQFVFTLPYLWLLSREWHFDPFSQLVFIIVMAVTNVGFINFFNFADGINGHVAIQFLLILSSWMVYRGISPLELGSKGLVIAPLLGSVVYFLYENMGRKSVFMGDAGSTFLGYLAATLPFQLVSFESGGDPQHPFLLIAIGSIFAFVLLSDVISVLVAKVICGIPLTLPHREHFYQRLSRRRAWGHSRTTLFLLAIQLIISLLFLIEHTSLAVFGFCISYSLFLMIGNFRAIKTISNAG
jgi:UDP-GlcNAc:undecaprenyl-phosphate GlcNAc-1-phosphate transferase